MHQHVEKDIEYYEALADSLLKGTITPDQRAELEYWYMHHNGGDAYIPTEQANNERLHEDRLIRSLRKRLGLRSPASGTRGTVLGWSVAAAALVVMAVTVFWWWHHKGIAVQQSQVATTAIQDRAPGQAGAVLHLSDGRQIVLDSLNDGLIAEADGLKIVKENGQLKYIGTGEKVVYNDIETARGRRWKMVLPDGTEVWLNAASSLHYPVSFDGQKERIVHLKGEAYFKVAHNDKQPFKVIAEGRVIEDIGTEFNVNAYLDEAKVVTTLVEGIVKVDDIELRPGQQALVGEDGKVQIKQVNTQEFTAWVAGQISLDNVSLEQLMKELSRWYDIDVEYKGTAPDIRLGGLIDRNVFLSDIISVLSAYDIHLKLVDRTLIVFP